MSLCLKALSNENRNRLINKMLPSYNEPFYVEGPSQNPNQ